MIWQKQTEGMGHTVALGSNSMTEANQYEWVSPSTLAERLGVSTMTIYNKMKRGFYEYQSFRRGKMIGYLIKVAKQG